MHEFLSANCNHRIDEYGGSYENRMRFLREIMAEVRTQVGEDFPICVRFSAEAKKCLNIPVITVGRINEPFMAEDILEAGIADGIAMGRASLADPAWLYREIQKYDNIFLHLNEELTADMVERGKPDKVILSSGARPIIPKVPGIDSENGKNRRSTQSC